MERNELEKAINNSYAELDELLAYLKEVNAKKEKLEKSIQIKKCQIRDDEGKLAELNQMEEGKEM